MKKAIMIGLTAVGLLSVFGCSGGEKIRITPEQMAEYNLKIQQADTAFKRGAYIGIKQAYEVYKALLPIPDLKQKTGGRFVTAGLLLVLKEKELGIINSTVFDDVTAFIAQNPEFKGNTEILEAVEHIPRVIKGTIGDTEEDDSKALDDYFEWVKNRLEPLNASLREGAGSTDFATTVYIYFHSSFIHQFEEKDDFKRFGDIFPNSNLLKYMLAIRPTLNAEALEALVRADPNFHEALFHLGELALGSGNVLTAEKFLQQAGESIPESTSILISLTQVYFHMEEFDTCLEYNETALRMAPTYRDALLGKALCLGYMNRHQEAVEALNHILELGKYLIGESHYWLAWNQNELELLDEARIHIQDARNFLIGHYEVASLDGQIAYKQKRLTDAEKYFLEALNINPQDCESAYFMGRIHSDREEWDLSGSFYERSALCQGGVEASIQSKIQEIEDSSLSQDRKVKMANKKKAQLLQIRRARATSEYNAAAGYFNAEKYQKALSMAEKAAQHPSFKSQAELLIESIKERIKESSEDPGFPY